jgi:hypothetical protein
MMVASASKLAEQNVRVIVMAFPQGRLLITELVKL